MSQSGPLSEIHHFINGEYIASDKGRTFENFNPANGQVIGLVQEGGRREVDQAVSAARSSLSAQWGKMEISQRLDILRRVAEGITQRADEFIEAECADTGKPYSLARFVDIPGAIASFKSFAELAKDDSTESLRIETPDRKGAINYTVRAPKGVVAVLCPWNAPLLILSWKVAAAMAWGNAVIVKPSEETPSSASLLGEVMNQAGVPSGVYNVVHGFGPEATGAFLAGHPGIDAISFTGETATGSVIMRAASVGLRDVSLELGGKNPSIIFADSDLDKATAGTMRSVFANCGQVCLGTERVYVERPIFHNFVQRLKAGAESLKPGDPREKETTLGPLISQHHRDKVLGYYRKAQELGAHIITGGGIPKMAGDLQNGYWIQPTIWTGLTEDSPLIKEEIFGPCCHVQPFDSEEEVIGMANDTDYGLACAIWTEDTSRGERLGRLIEAGILWINHWGMPDPRLPFGGLKSSGIGREGGWHSKEFYTELKNLYVKL